MNTILPIEMYFSDNRTAKKHPCNSRGFVYCVQAWEVVHKKIAPDPEKLLVNCTKYAIIKNTKARFSVGRGILPGRSRRICWAKGLAVPSITSGAGDQRERRECADEAFLAVSATSAGFGCAKLERLSPQFYQQLERPAVPVDLAKCFRRRVPLQSRPPTAVELQIL